MKHMNKVNCPNCDKELIRLAPFNDEDCYEIFDFGCDDCDIAITVWVNKNNLEEKETD